MLADNPTASAALASTGGSDTYMGSGGDGSSCIDNASSVQSSRSASVASRFASNVSRSASVAASSLASSLGSLDETRALNTHEEWKGGESGDETTGGDAAGNRGRGGTASSNRVGTASMGVTGSPGRGGVRKRPHTTSM